MNKNSENTEKKTTFEFGKTFDAHAHNYSIEQQSIFLLIKARKKTNKKKINSNFNGSPLSDSSLLF